MRYYFHLYNELTTLDSEGVELPDAEAALRQGRQEALSLAEESVREGVLNLSHHVKVVDSAGCKLFKVFIKDVVDVVS